jgi:hypothetical protein
MSACFSSIFKVIPETSRYTRYTRYAATNFSSFWSKSYSHSQLRAIGAFEKELKYSGL